MEVKKHPSLDFWCDNKGNVYDKEGNIKKYKPHKRYNKVNLLIDKKTRKTFELHRLVVETWISEIPKGMQVNHKDGNRQNNSVTNLEICTQSQNIQHAFDTGLITPIRGEKHYSSSLTKDIVLKVYCLIDRLYNNEQIAKELNIEFKNVSLLRNGARWSHLFKENNRKIIPAMGSNLTRSKTLTMLYLSYFSDKSNKDIAEEIGVDRSNISNIRLGKTYKWAFNNKRVIENIYKEELLNKNKNENR